MPTAKSQTLSLVLHVASLALLLLLTSRSIPLRVPEIIPREIVRLVAPVLHAGGSNQTAMPAKHGATPPQMRRTFIPPASTPDPKLPLPISVAFDSPVIEIDVSSIGDPSSHLLAGALGRNGFNGIGDHGCCGAIGPDASARPGFSSRPSHTATTPPQLIYKVEPEFSEEARKAKYQGVVLLAIEVDAAGHPRNLRVLQGLGLGLDEKAIGAVSQWRFRPGSQDGKPVVTTATVEVTFRLL